MFGYSVESSISLKIMEQRHAKGYFDFVMRNRDYLINWIPFVSKVESITDTTDYIIRYLEKFKNGDGVLLGLWDYDIFIGTLVIREIDKEAKWAEIGYMIDQNYQRRGLTKKSCSILIDYLFHELDLNRVEICCNEENTGSRKVAESLGFRLEGTIREHMKINNKIGTMMIYGLLRSEWK